MEKENTTISRKENVADVMCGCISGRLGLQIVGPLDLQTDLRFRWC
jgi:hypothetical protein